MEIRSSLKRKSMLALGVYLFFFLATIGTVTYWVVEAPFRQEVQQNLDLRATLLATQVREPLNSSIGVLQSIVSIGQSGQGQTEQSRMLRSLFSILDGVVISGGLWPTPNSIVPDRQYTSLFFNRASDGKVDQLISWNNPAAGGYDREAWYLSAVDEPKGSVTWSPVYVDSYTQVQMITASAPYYVDGHFAGVATVDLSLEGFVDFIADHAEEYGLGIKLHDAYGSIISEHNFHLRRGAYVSRYPFGDFHWQLEVVNARRLVNEQVYELISGVERGLIPLLLLCVMFGYYLLNRYLIKPIVVIAQKVDESMEGGIIDVPYHSQDEIRYLIDTFNQKTVYLEAEKVKAQASTKAKSAFLATLSHEIRTPMNGVLGTAQILLKSDLKPRQRQQMKSLYESGEHMMTLLNEILDFSKIEQGHLELDRSSFPLDSIIGSVTSVYSTLCNEKGLQFKVYSQIEENRWYYSDKARLRQILFNLLNNAVKFTYRGLVEVILEEETVGEQLYLVIQVRDTGIGIPKDAQNKIFKPFEQAESSTTRRFGGTGLGLAIVKQITELMRGSVNVVSEVGIGTSFTIRVAIDATESQTTTTKPLRHVSYTGLRVLIVEDNRTNSVILETFMKNKGFECSCVENGALAIKAVKDGHYDLILMDNHMPVKDGVEAIDGIRRLESDKAKVLIFGCTADVFKETREQMLHAGADFIIAKPIDENELDDALYRHANALYQFQTHQLKPVFSGSTEELLVKLYIALDNQAVDDALEITESLQQTLPLPADHQIVHVLEQTLESLRRGRVPSHDQIDLLTVLLTEFCN
ncbi:hybrid sensor histidine kinase/response regulator [Vibrio furnissii]|uniref:hybrid sensor histidine kinase/response regulator n=1 Tax=Vibrio furnissii TaxID=29494 RepID=UPI001E2F3A81|nr:hybrid sensor histidine kinase/response regulator [Vibrio furnissii]UHJ61233.1 ATP-binding protein [Vibrio furnissii]